MGRSKRRSKGGHRPIGLIWKRKNYTVVEAVHGEPFNGFPAGSRYWTVVNTSSQVHRHYSDRKTAITVATACSNCFIPREWGRGKMRKDVLYLMTGNMSVYDREEEEHGEVGCVGE